MRAVPSLAVLFLLIAPPAVAEPEGPVTRVLLVGDSWAEFMWTDRSLRDVFANNGRPDVVEEGSVTAISGTTAADWNQPSELQRITDELNANPTVDVVQLTLGGNDFLAGQPGGGWYVGISAADQEALIQRVLADLGAVVDHILAHDPGIQVLVSLYDYTNFVDSLSGLLFFLCVPTWNDLGQPTPEQVNLAALELQGRVDAFIAMEPRVHGVRHFGLMQNAYGFPPDIPPGQIPPPGDPTLPSPIEAMRIQADCFHLRPAGHLVLAQNLWHHFYADHFSGSRVFEDGFESGDLGRWSSAVGVP